MGFIAIDCQKCGANLDVDEAATTYTCKYCSTVYERGYLNSASPTPLTIGVMAERAITNFEFGKALQFIEQGLVIDPQNKYLLELEEKAKAGLSILAEGHAAQAQKDLKTIQDTSEAEQYKLQAEFILHELQANIQVYGSNSALSGATPANIDIALQYIDRSLELFPDNPVYLNLKALLLMEGKGIKQQAVQLLEKAASINPRDINIQHNLKAAKSSSSCFVATAAFGSPMAPEVRTLRLWRDERLKTSALGRKFVKTYYYFSPPLARLISNHPILKRTARLLLTPLVRQVVMSNTQRRL
jgi:tetratricopeptide (TPR) repeat protein